MRRFYALLAAAALLAPIPALAQVQGVGYRVAPSGAYVAFDGDAALTDGLLYGGSAGLSFGEFLELNGSYLFGTGFETDFSGFSGLEGSPALQMLLDELPAKDVDLQRYGGELKLNLARGAVVPFLAGGAGVVRFDPDGMDATRSLYLLGGAGLQFSVADRYALAVSADAFAYRYNPGTAFFSEADLEDVGLGFDNFNQTTVVNPSVRAALQVYLGGRRPGELSALDREFQRQFSGGLSGLSLVLEPFYARADFDEALGYSNQTFVGGEVGVDLGPLVGLRGFYGRGAASDDPTSFDDIQMVGGDVRLRLNAGDGILPFVSVGAGYLDVLDGYADEEDPDVDRSLAESRPFALGGAGVEVPFGRRLRAIGEVRALAMSTQDEGDVSQPDDVFLSPVYRVGLSVGLGGSAGRRVAVVRQTDLDAERRQFQAELDAQRARAAAREAELQADIERARAEGDADAVARLQAEQADVRAEAADREAAALVDAAAFAPEARVVEREVIRTDAAVGGDGVARALPTPIRTTRGERIVTIPLPETGELYVRYGDPGGVSIESSYEGSDAAAARPARPDLSAEELRQLVREAMRETLATRAGEPLTEADVAAIERRVEDRIADRVGDRLRPRGEVTAADLSALETRLEDRMVDEIRALREAILLQRPTPGAPAVVVPAAPATPVAPAPPQPTAEDDGEVSAELRPLPEPRPELRSQGLYSISPVGGFGFGESENLLVGLRAEYATGGALTYVPEILIGVTGRRTFAANLDATFRLPVTSLETYGAPYLRAGVGLVNTGDYVDPDVFDGDEDGSTALALNLGLGADLTVGAGRLFVDVTTGNLGRHNRLTAGYRFPFGGSVY